MTEHMGVVGDGANTIIVTGDFASVDEMIEKLRQDPVTGFKFETRYGERAKIQSVLDYECAMLVDDLAEAYKRGSVWSMGCGWTLSRIATMVDVGAKIPKLRATAMGAQLYGEMHRRIRVAIEEGIEI